MENKSLKFLKHKQKAHFKEHGAYATDDIQISAWIEEYHDDCVMSKALNDTVLDNAGEEVMLRKLWLKVINQRLEVEGIANSFDVTNFANDIIASYRMTFIDYIPPQPYEPPMPAPQNNAPLGVNVGLASNARVLNTQADRTYAWMLDDAPEDTL